MSSHRSNQLHIIACMYDLAHALTQQSLSMTAATTYFYLIDQAQHVG